MDMWWELLSKISQIIGRFRQMGRINCGRFRAFQLSGRILSFYVPNLWFLLDNHYFYKRNKVIRYFKGISIWDLDHASVVRDQEIVVYAQHIFPDFKRSVNIRRKFWCLQISQNANQIFCRISVHAFNIGQIKNTNISFWD